MAKDPKRKVIHQDHVCDALTQYLHSMSLLDKNKSVTSFYKVPEGLDVQIEVVND